MAKIAVAENKTVEAIGYYRKALRLRPDSPEDLDSLAWLLATDRDAGNRDGAEAVRLAQHACELTQNIDPLALSTLAAAYAEAGRFSDALKTAEAAITYGNLSHEPALVKQTRARLKLYAAGQAFRQPPQRRAEDLGIRTLFKPPGCQRRVASAFCPIDPARKLPVGWPGLVLGNLLVLLFLLSFLPPAGETYYRFFYDATDSFGFTKVCNRWFERHWHLNPSGCRDDIDYFLKIKPGKRRVAFVGDSFAAGQGIKDAEDRFPNRIRRAHPDWEIHLLAQLGYDTGDELKYLQQNLDQGYQVDQVVLVYCLNDVSDLFPDWGQYIQHVSSDINQSSWLWQDSYLFNLMYYRLGVARSPYLKDYFQFVSAGYRDPVWEQQQQRLKAFRDLVQSHGGRLLVVTFPFVVAVGPNYQYKFVHDELDHFWLEQNVPHLDLLPVYQDLPAKKLTVNGFDAHPNEFANQLAAPKPSISSLPVSLAPTRRITAGREIVEG